MSIDDELLAKAMEYTGIKERATVVRMALEALVAREAGRRLAALGGSIRDFGEHSVPRRRFPPE